VDRPGLDFLNTIIEEYDSIMGINLKGTYFMWQTVDEYMAANQIHGHMLIISSQSALEPSWSPYRLSKLGIDGITRGMAQRLLEHGIIVNVIGPGPTATTMNNDFICKTNKNSLSNGKGHYKL
jgi:NAD(P)-dependent dehydrogenase (short-subunit alcohol dehydrogenase family)